MSVKHHIPVDQQMSRLGKHGWAVNRLFALSKNLKVMVIPIEHLNVGYHYYDLSLREIVGHMVAVQEANLSFPIILDEDGELMDGRHRVMKALLLGKKTIKAVRFKENPTPCTVFND